MNKAWHSLIIDTAGAAVEFKLNDRAALEGLENLYAPFSTTKSPSWTIEVFCDDAIDYMFLDEQEIDHTTAQRERIWLRTPVSAGSVSIKRRDGFIHLLKSDLPRAFGLFFNFLYLTVAGQEGKPYIHASGVIENGKAFLFSGPSGAGKTTVLKNLAGKSIIHDDNIFIELNGSGPQAVTLPYMGYDEFVHGNPQLFPVGGVFLLHKDTKTFTAPVDRATAMGRLLTVPLEQRGTQPNIQSENYLKAAMKTVGALVESCDCRELHFTIDRLPPDLFEV